MTPDPFSHPIMGGLYGDREIGAFLGVDTTLQNMLAVEAAYAHALGQAGKVPIKVAQRAAEEIATCQLNLADLRQGMAVDGVCVPAMVRQLKTKLPDDLHVALHSGLTSQDVIDTALILSLVPILAIFETRLKVLEAALSSLIDQFGAQPLQGRTRKQAALPITVADRIAAWTRPLARHLKRLDQMKTDLLALQLGGPVGTREQLNPEIARHLAHGLGLFDPGSAWHTDRSALTDFADWLSLVTGGIGKIGEDICLMAQQGFDEISVAGGGTSSAMAHKANPILAETLVTLARYNATQLPGMHHALVHEQERSGSAWALEWMVLPSMIVATGTALNTAISLCGNIKQMGKWDGKSLS
ncbi:3-carboxy-cis,cis-muconate cycloisomerase [Yoonia sp. SS1-5]|uniref:3-carboxy-cis,cis-muconate cycloisomerase n=1 Tax=Yoonia rhodophyticola TaxID=3137370 RepID=A0AAN0M6K3_9RHOB